MLDLMVNLFLTLCSTTLVFSTVTAPFYISTNSPQVFSFFHVVFLLLQSHFGHVRLFATLGTIALQAPLSMGFSRQEYWSALPCPPPRGLSDTGIEPTSLMSPVLTGGFFTTRGTWEAPWFFTALKIVPCEVWCGESRNLENCVFEYVSLSSWQFLLSFFLTS